MNTIVTTTEIKIDKLPKRRKSAKTTYCISDGKLYPSATDASIAENIHVSTICLACRNGTPANGKLWCYLDDLQKRILDISNVMVALIPDAAAYRAIKAEEEREERERLEAERKQKEQEEKKRKLEEAMERELEKLEKIKKALDDLQNGNETMAI